MMRAKIKKNLLAILVLCVFSLGSLQNYGLIPNTSGGIGVSPNLIGPKNLVEPIVFDLENNSPSSSFQNQRDLALQSFVEKMTDGRPEVIRGVYSDDILALPVVQQPSNQAGFVSTVDGVATQFAMPASYGVIGLLAHNYLSGRYFSDFEIGDEIQIIYGDGEIRKYLVADIQSYQALQPNSPSSRFVDLDSGDELSATQLFKRVYLGDHHLTLQTCIEEGNIDSWGRMFIIANPI